MIAQYNSIQNRVQLGDKHYLKRFIDNRKLNLLTSQTDTIREWIQGVFKIEKITAQYHHQDIRNWFQSSNEII